MLKGFYKDPTGGKPLTSREAWISGGFDPKHSGIPEAYREAVAGWQRGGSIPGKVSESVGSGLGSLFGLASGKEQAELAKRGEGGRIIGQAAVPATMAGASLVVPPLAGKAADVLNVRRIAKATQEIKQAMPSGATPELGPRLARTIERGYLQEIERQYQPKTMREFSDALIDTANTLHDQGIKAAVDRFPTETISGTDIRAGIAKVISSVDRKLFPEQVRIIIDEARRYKGKDIPLPMAKDLLSKLNAMDRSLRKASPADAAAARRINSSRAAVTAAADAVRDKLYTKLSSLGQADIDEFQKDYGALRTVGETARKNITRAERIGKGPSLTSSLIKNHPYLTLLSMAGAVGGTEMGHGAMGTSAALIPFARWVMERRGVPNATIDRALGRIGKTE
jgi:hypothetical protein